MKPKALLFLPYLAPYRIDVLNEIGNYYNLTVVFQFDNAPEQKFDQILLRKKLKVNFIIFNKGFNIGTRQIRIGVFKLLKEHNPDVVFTNEYGATNILIALYKKINLFNYVIIGTTSDNIEMAKNAKWFRKVPRYFVLSSARGIIVYSEKVKNWYLENFPKLKVEVCPNIQNPLKLLENKEKCSLFSKELISIYNLNGYNIILYVGRLDKVKGLDLLLNAFAKTNNRSTKIVLVGEGKQKDELIKQAKYLKLEHLLLFPGRFDGIDLYSWYLIANFLVLPSLYEPFGAVVNEALVWGIPVLASKYIGALDYIKENKNGIIFDPKDDNEFISKLNYCIENFSKKKNQLNLMPISFEKSVNKYYTIIL